MADIDPTAMVLKATAMIQKQQQAAKEQAAWNEAMDQAKQLMGMMTSAEEKAAKAAEKVAAEQKKAAAATANMVETARDAIKSQQQWAQAMDQARKSMGMMTVAEEKAAKAAAKAAADQKETSAVEAAEAQAEALAAVEAMAVAAAAAIAAVVAITAKLAATAIEIVQQRAALLATFAALGGGADAGGKTLAMVDKLAASLPFAREQTEAWAKSLQAAGFSGEALGNAVKAVAAATAIMGASGGAAAERLLKQLVEGGKGADTMVKAMQEGSKKSNTLMAEMGLRIEDVAAAMGMTVAQFKKAKISAEQMGLAVEKALAKKGKGPLEEMAQTWPAILAKAKEGFLSIFEGLQKPVQRFMGAVAKLFGQFGRGTPAMKALGKVATEAFGVIFKYATMAVTAISQFIKQNFTAKNVNSTWASIKSAIGKVVEVLGKVWSILKPFVTSPMFLRGLVTIFKVIGVVVLAAVVAFGMLTTTLVGIAGAVGTVGAVLWGLIATVIGFAAEIVDGASSAGSGFIDGLVNGITSGAGAVINAVKSLASSALAAFKSVLGIASPSKVMMQMGGHVAAGAAEGIDRGTPNVAARAGNMGKAVATGASAGAKSSAPSGKSSAGLSIGELHLHVADAGHPAAWAEEAFAAFTERLAASQGL